MLNKLYLFFSGAGSLLKIQAMTQIFFGAAIFFPVFLSAQVFTDTGMPLSGMNSGIVEWGDYDNDGDLDLLQAGSPFRLYRNDSGTFVNINPGINGSSDADGEWGDYDNDGDLDILVSGNATSNQTRIFRNNGGGSFTDIVADLHEVQQGASRWGDFDNDGYLDVFISGSLETHIYKNNKGLSFTTVTSAIPGFSECSADPGDYDNDGDLDILINGLSPTAAARVYRNDGGTFTDIIAGMKGVKNCSAVWGDYDNDGDLDALIAGPAGPIGSTLKARIYRNDGSVFTDLNADLPILSNSKAFWGDYDNDGDLDILFAGKAPPFVDATVVYRNDAGTFMDIAAGLAGGHACAWGDYDSDGDLDIVVVGTATSIIYRNNTSSANTPPSAPTGLTVTPNGLTSLDYSWNPATDAETPSSGLSYCLWIGTGSGEYDISSPHADTATGWRKIVRSAYLQVTSWKLEEITPAIAPGTTYFACVSAIDAGFMGSPCSNKVSIQLVGNQDAAERGFLVAGPNPSSGIITISGKGLSEKPLSYYMSDVNGAAISHFSGSFSGELTLDISQLIPGLYFFNVKSEKLENVASMKIIKY